MDNGQRIIACGIVATFSAVAAAAELHVPTEYPTIQAAIDTAAHGDQVVVAPGTYFEAIDFLGKAIRLVGTDGPEMTIIDGSGHGASVVTCDNLEELDTVLEGFTIAGGVAIDGGGMLIMSASPTVVNCHFFSNEAERGGGMFLQDSSASISECTFTQNIASGTSGGGGVFNIDCSATISDCVFTENSALLGGGGGMNNNSYVGLSVINCTISDNSARHGGGVANSGTGVLMIACTLERNTAVGPLFGGGGIFNSGSPTIRGCTLIENVSLRRGGGMYNQGGTNTGALVIDCTFVRNEASSLGGGMATQNATEPTIVLSSFLENRASSGAGMFFDIGTSGVMSHCSFEANEAPTRGGGIYALASITLMNCLLAGNAVGVEGGGLAVGAGNSPLLLGCTLAGNAAGSGAGIYCRDQHDHPVIINSIVWGNTGSSIAGVGWPIVMFSDVEAGWFGIGNMDEDPLFVDPSGGDFRLLDGSPCIDAGLNNAVFADTFDIDKDGDTAERWPTDLDGHPRFADDAGSEDVGCGEPVVIDMGAYEFQGDGVETVVPGDVDGDGSVGFADILSVLSAWGVCPDDCCLADVDFSWRVDFADLLIILADWG